MKKIIQVTEHRLQKNKSQSCMIVVQNQSQMDSEFQQKILENKELLKMQRQNKKRNESQKVLAKKNNKNSKKLSLLQDRSTNNTRLSIIKSKSKYLFPKNIAMSPKSQNNNLEQNKIQLQPAIQKSDVTKIEPGSYAKFSVGINTQRQNQIQQQNETVVQEKQLTLKGQIKQLQKQQNEHKKKVIKVIKIQNKLDNMKKKISQRKSREQNRTKLSFRDQKNKINQHLQKINQQDHQNQRTNSTNLFDNIHEFLSNPHQKSNKSLKLSQRYNNSNTERNKLKLQQKIKQIEQKLLQYHKMENVQSKSCKENDKQSQIQIQQELLKKQSTIIAKLLSESELESYHQDSSMLSDYGMHWHRYEMTNQNEKHIIKKSNFEKQLKYIQHLQQKNNQNLLKFVQNQKLLHQIKLNKNKITVEKNFGKQFSNKIFTSI